MLSFIVTKGGGPEHKADAVLDVVEGSMLS
jgi:hypothetical protein